MKLATPDRLIIASAIGIVLASLAESAIAACILALIMVVACWCLSVKRGGLMS